MDTIKRVQTQFGKTAKAYVSSTIHAKGEDLQWMLEAGEVRGKKVLDIVTGGGHTALQFAKAGAEVIATDLTAEILQAAEKTLIRASQTYPSNSNSLKPKTSLFPTKLSTSLLVVLLPTTLSILKNLCKRLIGF